MLAAVGERDVADDEVFHDASSSSSSTGGGACRAGPLSDYFGSASFSYHTEISHSEPAKLPPLADFDASGFDLERDVRAKLTRYCDRPFEWVRLGVNAEDFAAFDLIPLKPKKTDSRYKRFVESHGYECAELDALPATELRRRVKDAITSHIDLERWERLQETERLEKESIDKLESGWSA